MKYLLDTDHISFLQRGSSSEFVNIMSYNLIVLTRNSKDFSKVPGLVIEDWTV